MKNLQVIFKIIKKYSFETGVSNGQCFAVLEKLPVNNSVFFPLFAYLRVLQSLGLIKLSTFRKVIMLTEKGKVADDRSLHSVQAYASLCLHLLRRAVIVAFLFVLFWPVFLLMHRQHHTTDTEGHEVHG
jgi:hypothetical protein